MTTDVQIFKVVEEPFEIDPSTMHKYATTMDGHYIGDIETANYLMIERGIQPELAKPSDQICSIGFCEKEQKWYSWSHRAIYGFGIGSEIRKGDCGYVPNDLANALEDAVRFWSDENRLNVTAIESVDEEGKACLEISWTFDDTIPNKKMRNKICGARHCLPAQWGRGEWVAKTLEDARQMACDFAEGVS